MSGTYLHRVSRTPYRDRKFGDFGRQFGGGLSAQNFVFRRKIEAARRDWFDKPGDRFDSDAVDMDRRNTLAIMHIQRRMSLRKVRARGVGSYLRGFDAASADVRTPATISLRSGDKKLRLAVTQPAASTLTRSSDRRMPEVDRQGARRRSREAVSPASPP